MIEWKCLIKIHWGIIKINYWEDEKYIFREYVEGRNNKGTYVLKNLDCINSIKKINKLNLAVTKQNHNP